MSLSISCLIPSLSKERIAIYQNYIKIHNPKRLPAEISVETLHLYLWNIKISSALFEIISLYEVTLRNKIFNIIDMQFRSSIQDRYFINSLPEYPREKLNKLINTQGITNALIVSRLSFSFWGIVLEKFFYDSGKRDKAGNPIYPRLYHHNKSLFTIKGRMSKSDFNRLVNRLIKINKEINDLRDRICHHEPVFKSNIRSTYVRMLVTLKYLDRNIYMIAKEVSRVKGILKENIATVG